MRITQDLASYFAFGQVEISRADRLYVIRGEIEIILVTNGKLDITCAWTATCDKSGIHANRWRNSKNTHFEYVMERYEFELHPGAIGELRIPSEPYEDRIVLYRKGTSVLNPKYVKGLELP